MNELPKIKISNFMIASAMVSVFAYTLGNIVDNMLFPEFVEDGDRNKILIETLLQLSTIVVLKYYINIIINTFAKTLKLSQRSVQTSGLLFPFMMYYPMDNFNKRVKYFSELIE
jgi:hypothetical protein